MKCLDFNKKAKLSLAGGFILHLLLGCGYMWGNLNLYFTSYYRNHEAEPSLTTSTSVIFNPILDFLASFMIVFAVPISDKLGARLSLFLTGIFMSLITICCTFFSSPYVFLGFYSSGIGLAYGFLWMIPLNNIYHYYPKKKGLCSGFILSGIGLGTATGNLIARNLINPNNIKPIQFNENESYFGPDVANNFPYGMRVLGVYFFVLTIVGSSLTFNYSKVEEEKSKEVEIIRRRQADQTNADDHAFNMIEEERTENSRPLIDKKLEESSFSPQKELKDQKEKENMTVRSVSSEENPEEKSKTMREELRHSLPHKLMFMNLFAYAGVYFMSANFKNYGILNIRDDDYLTIIGSAAGISNGVSRLVIGRLADKIGFIKTLNLLHLIQFFFLGTITFIAHVKELYLIWNIMIFMTLGGRSPVIPSICYDLFGHKKGSTMFSYVNLGSPVGNLSQFLMVFFISLKFGYEIILWVLFGFSFIALVLTSCFISHSQPN